MKQDVKMRPTSFQGETTGLQRAMGELAKDRSIILLDDARDQACFVCPAQSIDETEITLMARFGRGLICLALPFETVERLNLPLLPTQNRTRESVWRYTVSIEARDGISTGISAADRAHTIRTAAAPNAAPTDLVSPGHVFPILAENNQAATRSMSCPNAALDLVTAAERGAAAVLCMILNERGNLASCGEARTLALALGRTAIGMSGTDMRTVLEPR